ncbi:SMP-30/gluconolactonase/LRE family protein [Aestuariibacter halophilus]|uniref:SMP-30/gluconolactonase/LRE family protein n=1 Tax=Fluctibacter halophilus TaxID=226011 RepID=A0ABS8G9R0_9ALTE|nr:SMP-30/gluconolactonase/LRE family protein [Aestuariibacter halophilus]MCC2617305.1 SMP-30/gluconolactonase/LRE family protein [Aestuariibacter halophilus]
MHILQTSRRGRWLAIAWILALASLQSQARDSTDWVSDGQFTQGIEGPVVDRQGNLYAVNYRHQGTIGMVTGKDKGRVAITLPDDSVANGLRFTADHGLLIADYVNHNIWRFEPDSGELSLWAHHDDMHQPNDIAISASGRVYASDPDWRNSRGQLWMFSADGRPHLVEREMGTTNGIEISADERYLYVNESIQRRVWRYTLDVNGLPTNKQLVHTFADHGLDGMRSDVLGNLYIARYGAGQIVVMSPQGDILRSYALKGAFPTNVAFGGCDGKTLYVTLQKRGAIEKLQVETAGRAFKLGTAGGHCEK